MSDGPYTADDAANDAFVAIIKVLVMLLDQRVSDGALTRAECADLVRRFSESDRPNVEVLFRTLADELEASDGPVLTVIQGGKAD